MREAGERLAHAAQAIGRIIGRIGPGGETRAPARLERLGAMAHVSVTIDSRKYRLACNEGEEARLEVARRHDRRARSARLRASFGEIGDQRLVVMAALTIADNLVEAREAAAAERERAAEAAARPRRGRRGHLDALGARLEALAEQLAGEAEA